MKSWSTVQSASTNGWSSLQTYVNQTGQEPLKDGYSGGGYGSMNEPTAINMKQQDDDEDFWAWGETQKSEAQKEVVNSKEASSEVAKSEPTNGSKNLRKQSSSDFDESWGWDDEFTAKPQKAASSLTNGTKSINQKPQQDVNSLDANDWGDDGSKGWGQEDAWSNEDWSSVTSQTNTRKTIRNAGSGKKAD